MDISFKKYDKYEYDDTITVGGIVYLDLMEFKKKIEININDNLKKIKEIEDISYNNYIQILKNKVNILKGELNTSNAKNIDIILNEELPEVQNELNQIIMRKGPLYNEYVIYYDTMLQNLSEYKNKIRKNTERLNILDDLIQNPDEYMEIDYQESMCEKCKISGINELCHRLTC
jgi:hypothetical protein